MKILLTFWAYHCVRGAQRLYQAGDTMTVLTHWAMSGAAPKNKRVPESVR